MVEIVLVKDRPIVRRQEDLESASRKDNNEIKRMIGGG